MTTIVIAWQDQDTQCIDLGQPDIGISPKFKQISVPKAVVWLLKGSAADYQKAVAYARTMGHEIYRVFAYDNERDPLGKAKKAIMQV
jgi:hypothetical protein